jgi:hypothetical protein
MSNQPSSGLSWREGVDIPSPVREVLALGYYDGPTDGVLRCGDRRVYRFELLTWEQQTQDLRVFALSPLPPAAWDQLIALCTCQEAPRWPVWVPSWHEGRNEPVDAILQQAGPVEWVLATEDLHGEIPRVKAIQAGELTAITDWKAFLGLDRELPARVSLTGE